MKQIIYIFIALGIQTALAAPDYVSIDLDDDIKVFRISMPEPSNIDYMTYIVDRKHKLCFANTWYRTGSSAGSGMTAIPCSSLLKTTEIKTFWEANLREES